MLALLVCARVVKTIRWEKVRMTKLYLPIILTATLAGCGGGSQKPASTSTIQPLSPSSVQVTSPTNNSTVPPQVHFAATASTTCAQGIATMGVYTAPNVLAYSVAGATLGIR